MSALLAGGPEALLKLLPAFLCIFVGCAVGVLLLAWVGCAVLCRGKKE